MNTIAAQILDGLVPGIVSGLVTSVILFIFLKYWTHVFIPWFEKRVYRGVRIDRKWRIRADNTTPGPAEITVTQSAHRISGTILWQEAGTTTEYELTGAFCDLILTASYKQRNVNNLDRGTITLLCLQNGQLLKGCYAWYDVSTSQIVSGTYEWYPV
ncbi:MAG TPA: hypothetical protein VIE65_11265 [Methylobacter sp.]|jgi:hypothetical protein